MASFVIAKLPFGGFQGLLNARTDIILNMPFQMLHKTCQENDNIVFIVFSKTINLWDV